MQYHVEFSDTGMQRSGRETEIDYGDYKTKLSRRHTRSDELSTFLRTRKEIAAFVAFRSAIHFYTQPEARRDRAAARRRDVTQIGVDKRRRTTTSDCCRRRPRRDNVGTTARSRTCDLTGNLYFTMMGVILRVELGRYHERTF